MTTAQGASTTTRELELVTLGEEVHFLLRPTTGDEGWGPTHGDPCTAKHHREEYLFQPRLQRPHRVSSNTTTGPALLIQVCDDIVRIDDFSTKPASLQPSVSIPFPSKTCWRPPADFAWEVTAGGALVVTGILTVHRRKTNRSSDRAPGSGRWAQRHCRPHHEAPKLDFTTESGEMVQRMFRQRETRGEKVCCQPSSVFTALNFKRQCNSCCIAATHFCSTNLAGSRLWTSVRPGVTGCANSVSERSTVARVGTRSRSVSGRIQEPSGESVPTLQCLFVFPAKPG